MQTNVLGTQNLLEAARRSQVKRFVHVSTDEVYGSLDATGLFYEETPLEPTSPYAASKAASDLLALAYYRTYDFDVVITRCTNNYGPYQFPEKLIPLFITNALADKPLPLYGDGRNVRSWLHVDDHSRAIMMVLERGKVGEVYNVGGAPESEKENRDVTAAILSLLGKPADLIRRVEDRKGHDRRYAVDFSKINRELGWAPKVDFESGLKQTVQWYLDNHSWWEAIKSGEYQRYYDQLYGERLKNANMA